MMRRPLSILASALTLCGMSWSASAQDNTYANFEVNGTAISTASTTDINNCGPFEDNEATLSFDVTVHATFLTFNENRLEVEVHDGNGNTVVEEFFCDPNAAQCTETDMTQTFTVEVSIPAVDDLYSVRLDHQAISGCCLFGSDFDVFDFDLTFSTTPIQQVNVGNSGYTVCEDGSVTMVASGPGTLKWYLLPDLTNEVHTGTHYTVTNAQTSQTGTYRVVSDVICTDWELTQLYVHETPVISVNSNIYFCENDFPYDFSGEANVTPSVSGTWTWPNNNDWTGSLFDPGVNNGNPTSHTYSGQTVGFESVHGCVADNVTFSYGWNDNPEFNEVVTDASCFGVVDGEIEITPDGDGPLDLYMAPAISAFPNQSTYNITLGAGSYQFTLIDNEGCTSTAGIDVGQPDQLLVGSVTNLVPPICQAATTPYNQGGPGTSIWGSADFAWSGGTAPYNVSAGNTGLTGIASQSATISGITGGEDQEWTITDVNGCTSDVGNFDLLAQVNMVPTVSGGNATCEGINDGAVIVNVTNATTSTNITTSSGFAWDNGTSTNANLGLAAGSEHDLVVTSAEGCQLFMWDLAVGANDDPFSVTVNTVDPSCPGVPNGEISTSVSPAGSYTYNWSTGANSSAIADLLDASYTVTVTDGTGCHEVQSVSLTAGALSEWHPVSGGIGSQSDQPVAVITDDEENVFVAGHFTGQTEFSTVPVSAGSGSVNEQGIFLARYDACGKLDWVVTTDYLANAQNFEVADITLSGSAIYLLGKQEGSGDFSFGGSATPNIANSNDWFMLRINKGTGVVASDRGLNSGLVAADEVYDLEKFCATTNIFYAAGRSNGTNGATVYRIRYNTGGVTTVFDDQANMPNSEFRDIEWDASTNSAYMVGTMFAPADFSGNPINTMNLGSASDAIVVRATLSACNATSFTWTHQTFSGNGGGSVTEGRALEFDPSDGHLYVTGGFDGEMAFWGGLQSIMPNAFLARIQASNLNFSWASKVQEGPNTQSAAGRDVIIDANGDIVVVGNFQGSQLTIISGTMQVTSNGSNTSDGLWIASFQNNQDVKWSLSGISSSGTDDVAAVAVAAGDYNNYITGVFQDNMTLENSSTGPVHANSGTMTDAVYTVRFGGAYTQGTQGQFYRMAQPAALSSLTEVEAEALQVFPNPATNMTSFASKANGIYRILDLTGKIVATGPTREGQTDLNLERISSGTYLLQVTGAHETQQTRFVVGK